MFKLWLEHCTNCIHDIRKHVPCTSNRSLTDDAASSCKLHQACPQPCIHESRSCHADYFGERSRPRQPRLDMTDCGNISFAPTV